MGDKYLRRVTEIWEAIQFACEKQLLNKIFFGSDFQ